MIEAMGIHSVYGKTIWSIQRPHSILQEFVQTARSSGAWWTKRLSYQPCRETPQPLPCEKDPCDTRPLGPGCRKEYKAREVEHRQSMALLKKLCPSKLGFPEGLPKAGWAHHPNKNGSTECLEHVLGFRRNGTSSRCGCATSYHPWDRLQHHCRHDLLVQKHLNKTSRATLVPIACEMIPQFPGRLCKQPQEWLPKATVARKNGSSYLSPCFWLFFATNLTPQGQHSDCTSAARFGAGHSCIASVSLRKSGELEPQVVTLMKLPWFPSVFFHGLHLRGLLGGARKIAHSVQSVGKLHAIFVTACRQPKNFEAGCNSLVSTSSRPLKDQGSCAKNTWDKPGVICRGSPVVPLRQYHRWIHSRLSSSQYPSSWRFSKHSFVRLPSNFAFFPQAKPWHAQSLRELPGEASQL